MAHARAGDGREAKHPLCGRAERLDAQHERVGEVGRDTLAGRGGRQLLGEERVALGAGEELVDQPRLGPAAEDPRELGDHLLAGEALERRRARRSERARPRPPAHAADGGGAARRCGRWRRAARADGARCARRRPGSRARSGRPSGRPRRRACSGCASPGGPGGRAGARTRRPWESALSLPASGASSWGSSGARPAAAPPSSSGVEAAQRADDRRVGQLAVAEVDAVAGEHARALRARAGGELGDAGASCRRPIRPRRARRPGGRRPRAPARRRQARPARARARRTRDS